MSNDQTLRDLAMSDFKQTYFVTARLDIHAHGVQRAGRKPADV